MRCVVTYCICSFLSLTANAPRSHFLRIPLFSTCCAVSESALNPRRGRQVLQEQIPHFYRNLQKINIFPSPPTTYLLSTENINLSMQIITQSLAAMLNNRSKHRKLWTGMHSFSYIYNILKMWTELVLIANHLFLSPFLNLLSRLPAKTLPAGSASTFQDRSASRSKIYRKTKFIVPEWGIQLTPA